MLSAPTFLNNSQGLNNELLSAIDVVITAFAYDAMNLPNQFMLLPLLKLKASKSIENALNLIDLVDWWCHNRICYSQHIQSMK